MLTVVRSKKTSSTCCKKRTSKTKTSLKNFKDLRDSWTRSILRLVASVMKVTLRLIKSINLTIRFKMFSRKLIW